MNKYILGSCFIWFFYSSVAFGQSNKWISQKPGFWNDATVWNLNRVPDISSDDTLILDHPVVLQSNLLLPSLSHLSISSTGGLCGHYTLRLSSSSSMTVDGILELDSIFVLSARVITNSQSLVTLYRQASITGSGGSWSNFGITRVGPWFDCKLPEFAFAVDVRPYVDSFDEVKVFPNPASSVLHIQSEKEIIFRLFDSFGRILLTKKSSSNNIDINISNFKSGLYFYQVSSKSGQIIHRPLQIN